MKWRLYKIKRNRLALSLTGIIVVMRKEKEMLAEMKNRELYIIDL